MITVEAYNYSRLNEIKDLLTTLNRNVKIYPFEITSVEKCKERFALWPQIHSSVSDYTTLFDKFQEYKNIQILNKIDTILAEQQNYVKKMHSSNKQWYIIVYKNGNPYGGVFLFQSVIEPHIFMMQAICKFQSSFAFELLNPEQKINLNDILIPYIERFITEKTGPTRAPTGVPTGVPTGAPTVYVSPLKVQEKILKERFNFLPINDYYPERSMFDVPTYVGNVWLYKEYRYLR